MSELKDFLNGGGSLAPQVDANTKAIAVKANPNFIVNGCGYVNNTSLTSSTTISNGAIYQCDFWRTNVDGFSNIKVERSALSSPPSKQCQVSMKTTALVADTVLDVDDYISLEQILEGNDSSNLIDKEFTLSFWVRSNTTGVFAASIRNIPNTYSYVTPVTIYAANTWEKKVITITSGLPSTFPWETGSQGGVSLSFCYTSGTNYFTPTVNSWVSGNFIALSGIMNLPSSSNNFIEITGVKVEVGNQVTDYVHNLAEEYIRCERRFQTFLISGPQNPMAGSPSNTYYSGCWVLPTRMRVPPNVTYSAAGQINKIDHEGTLVSLANGGFSTDVSRVSVAATSTAAPLNTWSALLQLDANF